MSHPAAVATSGQAARAPSSSLFFYFVAAALGVSFTGALIVLAWNNALENETRNFSFDAISVHNAVDANIRTADAVIDNLASFIAADSRAAGEHFEDYTAGALTRYPFIRGMAHVRVRNDGEVELLHRSGTFELKDVAAVLAAHGNMDALRQAIAVGRPAVPFVPRVQDGADAATPVLFLLQATRSHSPAKTLELAALAIDLPELVQALAFEPAIRIALYTESEGVAGRRLVYRKPLAADAEGIVVKRLREEYSVRLERFSVRLLVGRNLPWSEFDNGLVLVALVLGVGVTLLMIALARAKDLQARELEARNRVIEEQVSQQTHELAEARDQALEASRVKSDFLASMSHEIRTPLNAIIGMAELLSETRLSGDQANYVGVFRNAGEALLSLVNDILDLSKIEASRLSLETIDFNLPEIVEQAVEIYALKADAKGLELITRIASEVPDVVCGDPGRLRQVVLNLIGNAIKFTESGHIETRVRVLDRPDGLLRLCFEVADTGIGIPEGKLETIFGSFTQVDSSITRKFGGTGLGLTISKRLVELMSGRIWATSSAGTGSTFTFEVVLGCGASPATSPQKASRELPRVLCLTARPPLAAMLVELMTACGTEAVALATGTAALNALRQARDSGQPYGALLVDSAGEDAFAFIQALRSADDITPAICLFGPSSVAAGVLRLQALTATSYVVKPVKRAQLLAALRALVEPKSTVGVVDNSKFTVGVSANLLLVEDNEDNRLLVEAYLRHEPYRVITAGDGEQAVACFQAERFDLVLMDMQMPVMDGYAATRAIRAWERLQQRAPTPIVALTANAIKEDLEASLAAGCDEYLTKPLKKQVLLEALARRLSGAA